MKTYQQAVFEIANSAAYNYMGGGRGDLKGVNIVAMIFEVDEDKVYQDALAVNKLCLYDLVENVTPTEELAKDIVA